MKYPHLAARIFNTPLMIHPQKLDAIIAGLGPRLMGVESGSENAYAALAAQMQDVTYRSARAELAPELFSTRKGERSAERGYKIVDGVAVVSIQGALVHRSRFLMADSSFLLGYNDIAADIEDAMANSDVHAVMLAFDSPGGESQGAFELAERIHAMRGQKPMHAMVDGLGLSAAYLAASAADEIAVTQTGYAGSVGVVMRHVDLSRALANEGVSITHIFAGAHKVDGSPFEPLPSAVRADFQAEINALYDMFVESVATYRGMTAEAVRRTEAATYRGVTATAARLADRISTTDQMISELAGLRSRSYAVGQPALATATDTGGSTMSGTQALAGNAPAPAAFAQADLDRARAEGVQEGATAERTRVSAILGHEASACAPLALQCINTGLTAEQSTAILGAAPRIDPEKDKKANAFAAAMGAIGNPDVSGIEASGEPINAEAAAAAQILAAFSGTVRQ